MSVHVVLVDLVALVLATLGGLMVFAQGTLRRWWRGSRAASVAAQAGGDGDPTHYAMIIFGMMLFTFALILGGFTTLFAYFTRIPA